MSESQPPFPPPVPQKKGMPVLGWVGIGCGTILVIAVVAVSLLIGFVKRKADEFAKNPEKAAAELMVQLHPDLDKVSDNDAAGTMTIRTKDGQQFTMSYKDISEGKFEVTDASGNTIQFGSTDVSEIPSWVPRPADLTAVVGAVKNESATDISGIYTGTTSKDPDTLTAFFEEEAKKLGLTTSGSTSSAVVNGNGHTTLSFSGGDRELTVILTSVAGEPLHVSVSYKETK